MTIEIFGIPGSGKSTFCDNYSKENHFKNIMAFYRDTIIGRIIYKIFMRLYFIFPSIKKKYDIILKMINDKNYTNKLDKNIDIKKYIKYMLFIYYCEAKNQKRNGKIIVDEGIIHYSVALYAEFDVEFKTIQKIINLLKLDSVQYYLLFKDTGIAFKQMQERARKRCALDFLDEFDSKEMLNKYKDGETIIFTYLSNYSSIKKVS